jgi:hypothetical protein
VRAYGIILRADVKNALMLCDCEGLRSWVRRDGYIFSSGDNVKRAVSEIGGLLRKTQFKRKKGPARLKD